MYTVVRQLGNPSERGRDPQEVIAGFQRAMESMKQFSGFLGLEIWTAEDGSMQSVSRWSSKEAIDEYLNSNLFNRHHGSSAGAQHHGAETAHVPYYTVQTL
jgi:heme-degrading monooxygenase HmoA